MAHKIHTFRAATMDEALDLVRRELGHDAVVVDSKDVGSRRLLPWSSTRVEVEVQAQRCSASGSTPSSQVAESKTAVSRPHGQHGLKTLAQTLGGRAAAPLLPPMKQLPAETSDDDERSGQREDAGQEPSWDLEKSTNSWASLALPASDAGVVSPSADAMHAEASATHESLRTVPVARPVHQPSVPYSSPVTDSHPAEFQQLVDAGVGEVIARELLNKLKQLSSSTAHRSSIESTALLTALIEREVRCAPPINPRPGRREVVALIGPTGVGKTTTLAKLAGHFQLNAGLRVGLVTVDNYRVGAVEQIQTYADILQIPLKTAATAADVRSAIDEMDDLDLILIDTAGRSPLVPSQLKDLEEVLEVANPDHVLLVLSLATDPRLLPAMAHQFARHLATSIVVTKLDEAVACGGLLSIAREIPLPVSYLTTGQDVPDEIEPTHPARLARLILGRDSIHDRNEPSSPF